jgi:hypothetical protein
MIDSYRFGHIVIDGKEYTADVIIYPNRVDSKWWRKDGHNLCIDDILDILKEKPDILIIGTGESGMMKVPKDVKEHIESQGIKLIIEKTKKASDEHNKLSGSCKVISALHLTC